MVAEFDVSDLENLTYSQLIELRNNIESNIIMYESHIKNDEIDRSVSPSIDVCYLMEMDNLNKVNNYIIDRFKNNKNSIIDKEKRCIQKSIDVAIKKAFNVNIIDDYQEGFLLKEDSFKNCLYFHLRTLLADEINNNNLRIYTEYFMNNISDNHLSIRSDLAICQYDRFKDAKHIKDQVKEISLIELKLVGGISENVKKSIIRDIEKLNECVSHNRSLKCYLGLVSESNHRFEWGKLFDSFCKFPDNISLLILEVSEGYLYWDNDDE